MNTHLKGRIFRIDGISYLILSETTDKPEWLRVKALNAQRTVIAMHVKEIERHLGVDRPLTATS